ncbi:hypothetical protein FLT15_17540 [Paenibacillus thiaminolyticus]|uniref:DUF7167 family protein n=1 Tax=Paenibacillus thiaminolyticus TaxID=49283 RepID=UPI0013F603C8|nr:hypothetical protein [Paenibacillus thiaminolyticus]NGP59999.1 hypothetical protein [Paenibacillus thiaminolyticus]NGP60077.1 hypothetical protein [Paenibacillus thiaminolyticus]
MPKYRFTLHTGFAGCTHEEEYEIDDADLEWLTEEERVQVIEEHWNEWVWNKLSGSWEEVEDAN